MGRPKKIKTEELKVEEKEEEIKVPEYGNDADSAKIAEVSNGNSFILPGQTPNPASGKFCPFCKRNHEKSFDGFGINHEPFARGSKAETIFNLLCNQPKLPLFIPYEIGEKAGALTFSNINGLRINMLKGRLLQVPQQIAEQKMESMQINAEITDNLKVWNKEKGDYINPKLAMRSDSDREQLNA